MLDITQPPSRPLVAASILSADFGCIAQECRDVLDHGADLLHIDVMDGHFAPNLTMGQDMIRALRKHLPDTYLDVHMMVQKPGDYIDSFADAGANLLSFHLEADVDPGELIHAIHDRGMAAGMVVNPLIPPDGLKVFLNMLDLVLVMSVHPGRSGQKFMPEVLDKTRWIKENIGPQTRLEIDGGINPKTAPKAVAAGVDVLVSASAIFGADDRAAAIERLHGA